MFKPTQNWMATWPLAATLTILCLFPNHALAQPAGKVITQYTARLSLRDHENSKGQRLTRASEILEQDRANYHDLGHRDPADQSDKFFTTLAHRQGIRPLLGQWSQKKLNEVILHTPVVRNTLVKRNGALHLRVKVRDPGKRLPRQFLTVRHNRGAPQQNTYTLASATRSSQSPTPRSATRKSAKVAAPAPARSKTLSEPSTQQFMGVVNWPRYVHALRSFLQGRKNAHAKGYAGATGGNFAYALRNQSLPASLSHSINGLLTNDDFKTLPSARFLRNTIVLFVPGGGKRTPHALRSELATMRSFYHGKQRAAYIRFMKVARGLRSRKQAKEFIEGALALKPVVGNAGHTANRVSGP